MGHSDDKYGLAQRNDNRTKKEIRSRSHPHCHCRNCPRLQLTEKKVNLDWNRILPIPLKGGTDMTDDNVRMT
jgi:hypothetical protein